MKQRLFAVAVVIVVFAAACGGGDRKAPTAEPATATEKPAATATAKTAAKTPTSSKSATPVATSKSEGAVSGIFGAIFSRALNGPQEPAATGAGEGDPNLKQYLPAEADLPAGYTPSGQYTFRAPDGISETGGIDIAAEIASTGDATAPNPDFSKVGVLMAMVLKPDDLQSLGGAVGAIKSLSEQDLKDALLQGAGADGLFVIKDVRILDASGLGDGSVGFQVTIDLGAFSSIITGLAGDVTPEPGAPDLSNLRLTMRMYLFARGSYAGGVLRLAFSDSLADDVNEIGLASIIDSKLKGAPSR